MRNINVTSYCRRGFNINLCPFFCEQKLQITSTANATMIAQFCQVRLAKFKSLVNKLLGMNRVYGLVILMIIRGNTNSNRLETV